MNRRRLIALAGGAMAWPIIVRAQQPKAIAHVGYLGLGPASSQAGFVEALRTGLRELGYIEGKNIVIDFRWAQTIEELPALAAEFARLNVDIIFTPSSTQVEPAQHATRSIPIVFAVHADPVGTGHVASLARPGGNTTGLSMLLTDLGPKELQLLKEAVPHVVRIGVLWNPTTPSHAPALIAVKASREKLKVDLVTVAAGSADDFDVAFQTMVRDSVGGFLVLASPLFYVQRARLADLALKHRLPSMFGLKANVEAGGLMSYGADLPDLYRRAATYIDKILKGAKPADLPIEQASKYELAVNLNTAKALDVSFPPSILARADVVIE